MNNWILILLGIFIGMIGSFFGVGGGFIIVPLLLFLGVSAQKSVGTSLLAIWFISFSAVISHFRLGNIDYKLAIIIGVSGIFGAIIGSHFVNNVSETIFKKMFALLLLCISITMFVRK